MTNLQRAKTVFGAFLMLVCCAVLIARPDVGFYIIALILCISMIVKGTGALIFYITMARHMVGGKIQLYKGIMMLDIGFFIMNLDDIPNIYLMLYLLIGSLLTGVIEVLRAREAKRMEAGSWKLNMAVGITNIISGAVCVFCLDKPAILVYIYSAGLAYSACLRIVSAFRRTAVIYIQ